VANSLWVLTEERPKKAVLAQIVHKFVSEQGIAAFFDQIRIIPILDAELQFTAKYQIVGVTSPAFENIFLKIISGNSSFVDYLVFYQELEPTPNQIPMFAIEETKTSDSESRNTGVFQRATKFVYIDVFYPDIDKTMLYNGETELEALPTQTNIFGTRCFLTLGVKFLGKDLESESFRPFGSIDELIAYKSKMRRPPAGNVPIDITRVSDELITISGRLVKGGTLAHDPNIGALSLISAALRILGWTRQIRIVQHGLTQSMVRPKNKFVQIASFLKLELEELTLPEAIYPEAYWRYESTGEKLGTIFVHLVVEGFTEGFSIYENHAGCERGYFYTADGNPLAVSKRVPDEEGKVAKDAEKIAIPDLLLVDVSRLQIINVEGERAKNVLIGIEQLGTFGNIERFYVNRYYPAYEVIRSVVLYGGESEEVHHIEVSILLNSFGAIILGISAPGLFREAVKNLLDFWKAGSLRVS
jgi:hypothetical protein